MSELSKQALKVDNNQSFPNNNGGLITPAILRAFNTNMIDSMVDEISYNVDSASWNQQIDTLESTTASFNNSITQLNASSASQQISINALNSTTASLVGSSSLALYTASFNNGTRNLTFTKGDTTQFSVNIPDVSGSAGNFVTTASFNSYTQSTDNRLTNIESTTASLNSSVTQLNASSASQQVSINNLNTTTASLLIETQNLELFSASALISISNLNSTTASLNTSVTNINQFTQSAQAEIDSLQAATSSYANSASVATVDFNQQQQIDALIAVTASFVTSSTNITSLNAFTASQYVSNSFFATTGSNTFVGNQTITGNITALSASFTYLQTIYESSSVIYSSGSNIFGDELSDVQTLSGSVKVQGSLTVNGTPVQTSSVDITALNQATASLQQATASLFTSASLGLTTASVTLNTITFTKGDGTTFPITVNTGSGGGGTAFPFTGSAQITGSLGVTGSISSKAGGYATVVTLNGGQSNPGIDINGNGNTDYGLQFRNFQLSGGQGYEGQIQMFDKNRNRIVMMDTSGSVGGTQNQRFFIQQNNTSRVGINGYTGVQLGYSDTALSYPNQIFISSSVGNASDRNFIGFNADPSGYVGTYNYVFEAANAAQGGARTFIKGHLFVSQSFTASLQNGYAWVGNSTGYNTQVTTSSFATPIPTGTISGSQQITSLGFVSSSVTASSLVTASASGNTITFTKGDASTFNVSVDTGSAAATTIYDTVYTGESITKGDPLYISGSQGANPIVFKADAAVPAKMPVTYVSNQTIGAGTTTEAIILGHIEGVDLTGYTAGQSIYVAEGGGFSTSLPSGSNSITQLLGVVTKGGSGGKGLVLNPGPAQLPGLDTGKMWVGNGNNQPTEITTASFASSASFNSYTSSTNSRLTNIESTTASLLIETQNLETFSSSALISLSNLNTATASLFTSASLSLTTASFAGNTLTFRKGDGTTFGVVIPDVSGSTINTGSFATTGSNAFFGTNTFSGAVAFTGSAPTILSSSFSGSIITNLTDTYTDVAAVQQIVTLTSASYAALASGSLTNPNTLYIVSGSSSGGGGGAAFPYTGDAVITGSLQVTGSFRGYVSALTVASSTASIDMVNGNFFTLNLPTSSTTHISVTNIKPGQTINLQVSQSSANTGSVAFAPNIKFAGGFDYTATAITGALDLLSFVAFDANQILATSVKNLL